MAEMSRSELTLTKAEEKIMHWQPSDETMGWAALLFPCSADPLEWCIQ